MWRGSETLVAALNVCTSCGRLGSLFAFTGSNHGSSHQSPCLSDQRRNFALRRSAKNLTSYAARLFLLHPRAVHLHLVLRGARSEISAT